MSIRESTIASGIRLQPKIFSSKLSLAGSDTLDKLQKIWDEAGYEDAERQSLLGDLLGKIKTLCVTEVAAEQQILEHAKQEVETKIDEYHSFCDQLGRIPSAECGKGNNYADKLAELEKLLSTIEVEVSQRKSILDIEFNSIENLVESLGEESPSSELFSGPLGTPILSDVRLNLLRKHKDILMNMKNERIDEMKSIAFECNRSFQDLVIQEEGLKTLPDFFQFTEIDAAVMSFDKNGVLTLGIHSEDLVRYYLYKFI